MIAYGQVPMAKIGSNLLATLTLLQDQCTSSPYPLTFEQINHGFGYVLYTHNLKTSGSVLDLKNIQGYGYVFVNNVYKGMIGWNSHNVAINNQPGDILKILVENSGRPNYWSGYLPKLQFMGLFNASLDGAILSDWYQCGINLTESSVNSLVTYTTQKIENSEDPQASTSPRVFIGHLSSSQLQDTFFDSTGWGKGQLFINGFNLGRYWPLEGPQRTLYVPKPIIKQQNTVVLIELVGAEENTAIANFIDHPFFYVKITR